MFNNFIIYNILISGLRGDASTWYLLNNTEEPEGFDVTRVSNYWAVRYVSNMSPYKINLSDHTHLSYCHKAKMFHAITCSFLLPFAYKFQ
jgi:hypothetical protein